MAKPGKVDVKSIPAYALKALNHMAIEKNFVPSMGLTVRKEDSADEEVNYRSGELSVGDLTSEIQRNASQFSLVVAEGPPYEPPNPNTMTRQKYWELASRRAKSVLD